MPPVIVPHFPEIYYQAANVGAIPKEHPAFAPQIPRYETVCYAANSLK